MFACVLVANRGEIAVRIIATLRRLGIRAIAVYSDADAGAPHVRAADDAVRIGPARALDSYLRVDRIVDAATESGAEAVHPGYGFLAENADLAAACAAAGVVFVGPPVAAISAMGDKIAAKTTVSAAGVPVVPGGGAAGMTDGALVAVAAEVGFPVLLKPSAGGGGKGMRLVTDAGGLADAIASSRREAAAAFADDTLLVERFVGNPRHIEVQVLADTHGHVIHLGERECSLQRRHQKIVEEAPSPLLDADRRARMGAAAVEVAKSVGYTGAGTVEFIVDGARPDSFFFMEMNTRLQVEHPVTECITGLDLVEQQLRVAAGEPLTVAQDDVRSAGHAVEARIYAEDPAAGFMPSAGRVIALREPAGAHVRVDSGIAAGTVVGVDYDPMLAKVIAWGEDRSVALRRLSAALAGTSVLGVHTNTAFLGAVLADPEVRAGALDTGLVERRLAALTTSAVPAVVLVAAALAERLELEPAGPVIDPFAIPSGFRLGGPAWSTVELEVNGTAYSVDVQGRASAATVRTGDGDPRTASVAIDGADLVVVHDGHTRSLHHAVDADGVRWLGLDGATWQIRRRVRAAGPGVAAAAADGPVRAPMPGTVTAVQVAAGDVVAVGQPLVVIEAMKMEHVLTAPLTGTVATVDVRPGESVALGQVLATVEAGE